MELRQRWNGEPFHLLFAAAAESARLTSSHQIGIATPLFDELRLDHGA